MFPQSPAGAAAKIFNAKTNKCSPAFVFPCYNENRKFEKLPHRAAKGVNMSSTSKTPYLGLNQWVESDVPLMNDFNLDNLRTDQKFQEHCDDDKCHLSAADREKLNAPQPFLVGSYLGDGAQSRSVSAGLAPRFGIIFSVSHLLCEYDPDDNVTNCALGFLTQEGGSVGITPTSSGFTVVNIESGGANPSMPVFNVRGVRYCYALWR